MRNVDYGIFQTAFQCRDEQLIPAYMRDELDSQIAWFRRNLPSPDARHFERCGRPVGICWFRDDARAMIRRARHIAGILSASNIWITEAHTLRPGHILYRDDYQIIAIPAQGTPTKWG